MQHTCMVHAATLTVRDPSPSQPSKLSTQDGDGSEDDDEGNDKFDAAAAADDDDDEARTPGYGCKVVMMRCSTVAPETLSRWIKLKVWTDSPFQ